jgi:hypothetical protein
MNVASPGAEQVRKDMADELQRYARQASAAAGSFIRWSVYLETDPDAAIRKMRTVLVTSPAAKNPSPFLSLIAAKVLLKIDPASIEHCRQRREQLDREWAEICSRSRSYWEKTETERAATDAIVAKLKTGAVGQDGNVVSVEFGGGS